MKIPLFPLGSVLFPDGLLPLRVFELRYTDMVRDCMRAGTPFGVVLIDSETQSAPESAQATKRVQSRQAPLPHPSKPQHYAIGTLATIVDFDMREPGVLLIAVNGGQRFRVLSTTAQANGLIVGEVEVLAPDAPADVPPEYELCSELLTRLLQEMDRQFAHATRAGEAPFCTMVAKPYRVDEAVWLSNRHAELMPIPTSAKQALLALTDPIERLSLIVAFLKGHDVFSFTFAQQ